MKISIKFCTPLWLIVLLFSFGLFSCDSEDITTNENDHGMPSNNGGMVFAIVDKNYNNLFKDKHNAPYDFDYIHIITPDGKYRDNLKEQYIAHYHRPYYEGSTFVSSLLDQIASSGTYEKKYWKTQYENKPLYLILSPTDTDTIMWKTPEGRLYHNGKATYSNAIIKDLKK